jgi:hypothetical protein
MVLPGSSAMCRLQLPPKDFFLSAGQSKVEAMEPIEAATKRGILLILLGLLAAMYLAWVGGRKFIKRPIANLLEVTAEWGKGHYDARVKIEDRPPKSAGSGWPSTKWPMRSRRGTRRSSGPKRSCAT